LIHIVGIVGVPGSYGGFETLADHLLDSETIIRNGCNVYCEKKVVEKQGKNYKGAKLVPLRWKANGWQSIFFDLSATLLASREGGKVLILGTSATFALPFFKLFFPKVHYIVNMAGLEWSREKWGLLARSFLKFNEMIAAKFSHKFITDNQGLKEYIKKNYNIDSILIPYGGDQFLDATTNSAVFEEFDLPKEFDFAMARAQIDNNMEVILNAYAKSGLELVYVSNWGSSEFGKSMLKKFGHIPNLNLIGPIYDINKIKALYKKARLYVHGHSAGGTNPVLVESMWAKLPILAFDVSFNKFTTQNEACYYSTSDELIELSTMISEKTRTNISENLFLIAKSIYKWEHILSLYEAVLFDENI
jgi:glycosyltransferase involved in cell wall biosynthesis